MTPVAARRRPQSPEVPPAPSIDRIRQAALRIFAQRGYHATSVRDITRACGLVPAALYNHFASKADLLQDLLLQGHHTVNMRVDTALRSAGEGADQRLECVTRELAQFHAEFTELATLSNREFRALPEPQSRVIISLRRRFRALLEDILADGIAAGIFHVPLVNGAPALTVTAMSILDSLQHIAEWYRPDREFSPQQIAGFYAEWIAASVHAPPGPAANAALPAPAMTAALQAEASVTGT
jgi:AcrR family transcriptional regulator